MSHRRPAWEKKPAPSCSAIQSSLSWLPRARTGEWLCTDHLVESERIWCKANGAHLDWQEHILLGQMAAGLAPQVMETFGLVMERSLVPLFIDGWMLDYASPVVCCIHEVCIGQLANPK